MTTYTKSSENLAARPKNIYGVSKIAAEDVGYLFHKQTNLPIVVLRVNRFFLQPDDDDMRRNVMFNDNLKVLELSYRRADIRDVVDSCVAAMEQARGIAWGRYVISAPSPFKNNQSMLQRLNLNAGDILREKSPKCITVFQNRDRKFLTSIDRVYDSTKAQRELGWIPKFTFEAALDKVDKKEEWRGELALKVGRRGYHAVSTAFYTSR